MKKPTSTATAMPSGSRPSSPAYRCRRSREPGDDAAGERRPGPTDRSISPEMITAVMPKAMMPSIDPVRSTLSTFPVALQSPARCRSGTTTSTSKIISIG